MGDAIKFWLAQQIAHVIWFGLVLVGIVVVLLVVEVFRGRR